MNLSELYNNKLNSEQISFGPMPFPPILSAHSRLFNETALVFIKETSRTCKGATSEHSPTSLPRIRAALRVPHKMEEGNVSLHFPSYLYSLANSEGMGLPGVKRQAWMSRVSGKDTSLVFGRTVGSWWCQTPVKQAMREHS